MNIPECKEFKDKYNSCLGDWWKKAFQLSEPVKCDDVFFDYKDCVVYTMQKRTSKVKSNDSNDSKISDMANK